MNSVTSAPHENIAAELVRRGLPIDYAERAGSEITEHFGDLVAELRAEGLDEAAAKTAAAQRLGDARALVRKTVREYQRRHWCGRWPLATFVFGPIPLLLLTWLTTGLLVYAILLPFHLLGWVGDYKPDGVVTAGEWLVDRAVLIWFLFAAPALVVFYCARLARRASLRWTWVVMAAGVLAVTVGLVKSGFPDASLKPRSANGSALPADARLITLGLPILAPHAATPSMLLRSMWNWYTHDLEQAGQFLLPLVVAGALLLRARQLALRRERLVLDGC